MELIRKGRVWKFGDQMNTDLILPMAAMRVPQIEMHKYAFEAIRPGWSAAVQPGDLLIAGADFGLGSGRPVGSVLRACGIAGIVAESINGLCLRNCVNSSLAAISCSGVASAFDDGDTAVIDFMTGRVENVSRSIVLQGAPLPPPLAEIVLAGGIIPMLVSGGFIESAGFVARST